MKAYQYGENKKFEKEVNCQIDPLESAAVGEEIWLLPANCTFKEPLPEKENFDVVFDTVAEDWYYKEQPQPQPPSPEEEKQKQIEILKNQLGATDYKIIKCSECSLAGEPLPYDVAQLHAERQAIRDEINRLENE